MLKKYIFGLLGALQPCFYVNDLLGVCEGGGGGGKGRGCADNNIDGM